VERQFAKPITPDNLTPLYDVEALVARIGTEELTRDKFKDPIETPRTIRITRDL